VLTIAFLLLQKRSHLSPNLHPVPLAVSLGDQFTPSFSPDGRQVVFTWNGETQDNFDVYLKSVDSSAHVLRLTTDKDIEYSPTWSPDGQWIAFCRGTDVRGGAIWLIPALGGPERKIIDLDDFASPPNRAISWLRNSKALVVAAALRGQKQRGLHVVDIDSGANTLLTTPSNSEEDMHPAVSPDGRTVAFTRDTGRGISSVLVLPLAGKQGLRAVPIPTPKNIYNALPTWTPDGSHVAFISNAYGETHLWLSPARGSSPAIEIDALGAGVQDPVISGTGQLGFVRQTESSNIWALDLGPPGKGRPKLTRLFASTRTEETPAIRPDGKQIAFASNRSGYSEIWTGRADGSDVMQVTFLQNPVTSSPDWSPNGRRLVFDSRVGDRAHLYALSADGGQTEALSSGPGLSVVPHWSRDNKWIYFSSDRTGRMEVWRVPSHGGPVQQITRDGGFAGVPSPDGENLYYSSDNSPVSSLWQLQLATGKRTLVASSVIRRAYAPTAKGAYFFSGTSSKRQSSLWSYEERSQQKIPLLITDKKIFNGIAISSDEQTLYYSQLEESGHELLLLPEFWR
jgi:Tol biopolymer transport system component